MNALNKLKIASKWAILFSTIVFSFVLLTFSDASAQDGFEVGTEVYFFNYEEPDFMEDTGVFYGVNASYTQHFSGINFFDSDWWSGNPEARTVFRIDGRIAYGQVDYTSASTGEIDNINDFVFETRATGGYDFNLSEQNLVTPYIGLGYRYLYDDTAGKTSTTGAAGYQRESNYLYIPIGADLHGPINDLWAFNVNAEFDLFIFGKQKSYLGDAIAGLNTVSNDQNDGYGVRGSIRFTRENENTVLFIEPFIRYWHINDSETSNLTFNGVLVGYGLEPENKTIEAGLKIGLRF